MKRTALLIALILFAAASLPAAAAGTRAGDATAPVAGQARNCVPSSSSRSTSKAPPIRVCVSDPDTQLNLPWFLTDILTAVDTHQSPRDLLHKMRDDF
ncbi:hypothetical protein [Burkholderia sp. IMCC1007]|uniref:hypothetical protein n=1 Tax=Burkholderia sp. IMCC1007 TaxID=3004104 RepID=UPI0022B542F9|nr:hypothetical protein [Burkholderia sp. IMCC1007]